MSRIQVLDQITIDKIAAGEVIERPASIVKELVENSIDAGADQIKVEIEQGGISLIRITDNGCGIAKEEVPNAFLRHATSKIRSAEDLEHLSSLGFRGEALSSICAVARTELITKTKECDFGCRYVIEGGKEISLEETGAPDGTTFLVRQLFYNVPARRKFLRSAPTEAGQIQDLMMRLALSHPDISFTFLNNRQEKLQTSGNGKLKDVIYNAYGRDVAANLLEVDYRAGKIHIAGWIGKPVINRSNRNFETIFVNGRYVKSPMVSKAVEDAYRDYVMQHKFPFFVLHFHFPEDEIDVNVHPAKMELRFQKQQEVYHAVYEAVHRTLLEPELIPDTEAPEPAPSPFLLKPSAEHRERSKATEGSRQQEPPRTYETDKVPEPMVREEAASYQSAEDKEAYFIRKMRERVLSYHKRESAAEVNGSDRIHRPEANLPQIQKTVRDSKEEEGRQMELFEERFLNRDVRAEYRLIGQVFETYWLVEFDGRLFIIDQHAAHERVLYERIKKEMKTREFTSQYLSPPIILSLTMQESELLKEHLDHFTRLGFEIEPFGGESYAVRAVPGNLFGIAKKELLLEMLDGLSDGITGNTAPDLIEDKIASMSCKAAVKGNSRLSAMEMDALIGELLTLDNPYHCPHGRPTIISMTKRELEKKFKRIV